MNENDIFDETTESTDIERSDEFDSDIEGASVLPRLVLGGAGFVIGILFHKFVMPKIEDTGNKARKKLIEVLSKDNDYVELDETSEDSEN